MKNNQNENFFARLIAPMLDQLRRIASGTRGEQSVDDLKTEAWIAAQDVRAEFSDEIEPEDERLQSAVLYKLRRAFGKFVNRQMRFAVQLDHQQAGEDGEFLPNAIAASMAASEVYEPEVALERAEEYQERERRLMERFTEAAAYLRALDHFDGDRRTLASHLAITVGVLSSRLGRAEMVAQRQPSMFDGIELLPLDFLPRRGIVRGGVQKTRRWFGLCSLKCRLQLRFFSGKPALF